MNVVSNVSIYFTPVGFVEKVIISVLTGWGLGNSRSKTSVKGEFNNDEYI